MAAKDTYSVDIEKKELADITTCCICTDIFTDPKALPCIHTFCLKCLLEIGLKTKKGPGDEMACPLCRRQFKIPSQGFHGLPKNFFIERLIQMANIADPPETSKALCYACMEDSKEEKQGKKIPTADVYCADCKHKLCEECCSEHRKFKLTKNHKLMPINEERGSEDILKAFSVCEIHEQRILDVYCANCKAVVCAICFIDDHSNHNGSHVNKYVDGFRKQIEDNTEAVNRYSAQAQLKKAELLKVTEDTQKRVANFECDVTVRKDELKQLVDKHANSLLHELSALTQSKLKEIQVTAGDVDTYLSCLETYNSYCKNIMAKGSASDICRAASDLCGRAVELKQQCQSLAEREIQSFKFCFAKSELEEFLAQDSGNLIGSIEVNRDKSRIKAPKATTRKPTPELDCGRNDSDEVKKDLKKTISEKFRSEYKSDPVLVQTLRTKAALEKKKAIHGMTILDKELFVVIRDSSEVEAYDSHNLNLSRRWCLKELIRPGDLGSCYRNKCLYILDYKDNDQSSEILRVAPNGKLIKNWSTGNDYGHSLSVTGESNVIVTVLKNNKITEFSPDGLLIREINLSSRSDILNPLHAVRLTNGHFLVSHGRYESDLHRMSVVDADGKLKKSFGGKRGSNIGQMNLPVYLSVDGNGFVMVADRWNSRVLLLNSDLEFKREMLSKEEIHGLRHPMRIVLDESNGRRLFVADNEWDSEKAILRYGRIFIFQP